jgi:hypothetical protein
MGSNSTGLMNRELGDKSTRDLMQGKIIWGFSGAIPANADAAETGTRMVKITTGGAIVKVKQKITITPVVGDAAGDIWSVTLNGITAKFTDDGTPSVSEVCTGLSNALKILNGTAITTPASIVNIPATFGLFTITDNGTNLTVEAATADVPFEYSAEVTGATTASLTAVLTTDNAYGLRFEPYSGVSGAILERKSGDTWSGLLLSTGVITHCRIQADDDTGALSTTAVRMQGNAAVANAEFIFTHVSGTAGETVSVTLGEIYKEAAT